MSFLDIFKRKQWEKLGEPIDHDTLYEEIRLLYNPSHIALRDADFRSIPFYDWDWLNKNYVRPMPSYKSEIADCDDMCLFRIADIRRGWIEKSRGKEAQTSGWVTGINPNGGAHQWVWQRDDNGIYRFVEGQTGELMVGTPKAYYSFEA